MVFSISVFKELLDLLKRSKKWFKYYPLRLSLTHTCARSLEKHQIYANKVAGESIQPSPDVFDVLLTVPRGSC